MICVYQSKYFRATRRALYFSVTLNIAVSFSGVVAITMFGTFLFEAIGFTASKAALANCIATLAGTVGVIFGALTIDKVSRSLVE